MPTHRHSMHRQSSTHGIGSLREAEVEAITYANGPVLVGETLFDADAKQITGPATEATERLRNQARRHGIRFYSRPVDGTYQDWR